MNLEKRAARAGVVAVIILSLGMSLPGCRSRTDASSRNNGGLTAAENQREKTLPAPCRGLETFSDEVVGFSLKRPEGWRLGYMTGVIFIVKDDKAREGVLIYPVRPRAGYTLEEFFSDCSSVVKKSAAASSRYDFSDIALGGKKVSANVSGTSEGASIAGSASAFLSGKDYVFTLGWAPKDSWGSRGELLGCVAESYRAAPGQPLVRLAGTYFETMAPKGWRILEETSNSVNFANPSQDAGVLAGYLDFGGDSQPMTVPRLFEAATTPCRPGQQPCFSVARQYTRLAAVDIPDFRDAMGRTWKSRAEEFEAVLVDAKASKVHGVLSGMVTGGRHVTGLYGWIVATATRVAKPETWERNSAATAIVQDNLKIIRASELITRRILPRNNPYDSSSIMGRWEAASRSEAGLSAKRQEALMGYETYQTPTGERVDVPLNSIPGGDLPLYFNSQTNTTWSSALEPPPLGFVQIKR